MSEVLTAPTPVARQCRIEQVLDAQCLALLQRVPRNPQVRALLLKLTGQAPPPECETFEQLRDWLETHCQRRVKPVAAKPAQADGEGGIVIQVDFSETEYGRADYSVRRFGSENFRLGAGRLMELVREAIAEGGGLDQIVERIATKVDEDAWSECDPSLDDYGDYHYEEHDSSDTGNCETSFSRADLRRTVLAFLRERHPELAAEL